MIVRYEVFYRDHLIGILTVDEAADRYCYEPDAAGVAAAGDRACLNRVMIEGSNGFIEPIPFFQNRLMNMKRNGLHMINYQTDHFTVKEIMA